jgi:hypothetical protein
MPTWGANEWAAAGSWAAFAGANRRLALVAFPIVLWFVATFFFFGDIGRWSDDWFYIQRVPESGAIRALILDRPIHIWRPLYRVVVPALATILSEHVPVLHLLSALAHGATTWLLYVFLRRLGFRPFAAAGGSLIFMVFPWDTEVVFWCCNLPTSLSASVALITLLMAMKHADRTFRVLLLSFALTFIACCLNEQPALIALAVPLAVVNARSGSSRVATTDFREIMLLLGGPIAAMSLYTALARWIMGPMDIGAGHGLLPPTRWVPTVLQFCSWLAHTVGSSGWMLQAWRHALAACVEYPMRAGLLTCALLASGVLWAARLPAADADGAVKGSGRAKPVLSVFIGLAILLAPLGPIIAFEYWLHPRIIYPSAIGVAILVAVLLSKVTDRLQGASELRLKSYITSILVLFLAAASFAMVGIQRAYRDRSRLDDKALSELRELVPHPAPESIFVPVEFEPLECPPGARVFEQHFWSVFNSWWSAGPVVRLTFQRSDLDCAPAQRGERAWRSPTLTSVIVKGFSRVAWDRVIPFRVKNDGSVELVTTVRFTTKTGVERSVTVAQTNASASGGKVGAATWIFPSPKPRPAHAPVSREH